MCHHYQEKRGEIPLFQSRKFSCFSFFVLLFRERVTAARNKKKTLSGSVVAMAAAQTDRPPSAIKPLPLIILVSLSQTRFMACAKKTQQGRAFFSFSSGPLFSLKRRRRGQRPLQWVFGMQNKTARWHTFRPSSNMHKSH